MGAIHEQLSQLQELETQIVEHRRRLETRRRQIQGASRRIEQCVQEHEATLTRVRDRQAAADALELQIKSNDAQIGKLREVLNRAKSNREYAAVLTQINTTKADNTKEEEQVLQLLSEVEAVRNQAGAQDEQRAKEEQRLAGIESEFSTFEASISSKLEDLSKRRDQVVTGIPTDLVSTFDRVASKHDGEGLAEVVRENPRREEFSCGGCSMAVTLEQVNRIRYHDEVNTCNFCGRILLSNSSHTAG